jgi:anti-sigma28 factor (negative regulator of flagellin synthesis)
MKVRETTEMHGVERTPAVATEPHARPASPDKVTVENIRPPSELITAARQHATAGRAARLQELEAALKAGHYRPDAQRIADQMLSAAEVDARLRAMMQRG